MKHKWRADDDEFSANRLDVIGPGGWWRDDDDDEFIKNFKRFKFPITTIPIVGPGGLWRDDDEFIGGPRITSGGGWFGFDDDTSAQTRPKWRVDDDQIHLARWRADDDEFSANRLDVIGPGGWWRDDDEFIGGPRITSGGGWFGFDDDVLALPREFWAPTLVPWNGRFGGAAEFIETDDNDELLFDFPGSKRPQYVIRRTKESRARHHTELGGNDDAGPRISSGGFRMRD